MSFLLLTLAVLQDVGGESSLVSHVDGVPAVLLLDHLLQGVVQLRAYPQRLPEGERGRASAGKSNGRQTVLVRRLLEGLGADRKDHELLHGQFVSCVGASVYHVEGLKRKRE